MKKGSDSNKVKPPLFLNYTLIGIVSNKKITMHIARHSFGNIAGDNIPVQLLQQLYRHSSITTTMMYQSNFMNKKTDDALQSVVNF